MAVKYTRAKLYGPSNVLTLLYAVNTLYTIIAILLARVSVWTLKADRVMAETKRYDSVITYFCILYGGENAHGSQQSHVHKFMYGSNVIRVRVQKWVCMIVTIIVSRS